MKEIPKNIPTNLYKGSEGPNSTERGIYLIHHLYNYSDKEGLVLNNFFDSNLKKHLERIKTLGKDELVLIDIGSGEGMVLVDLLDQPNLTKESRQFLTKNPNIKITAIGLTDSPNALEQGKEKHIIRKFSNPLDEIDLLINKRIKIKNYFWTLSGRQNLSDFLEHIGIQEIDLVYATEVFQYLSSRVFNEVINTVAEKLSPEGQLFCSSFSGIAPGFFPYKNKFLGDNHFDIKGESSWKRLIIECSSSTTEFNYHLLEMSYHELKDNFEKSKNFYIRLGALDRNEIKEMELLIDKSYKNMETSDKLLLIKKAMSVLATGMSNLRKLREKEEYQKKTDILKKMNGVIVDLNNNGRNFNLTKKSN